MRRHAMSAAALAALGASLPGAAGAVEQAVPPTPGCRDCAAWNAPAEPFRIFANVYYVGTQGLSAVLVASDQGHVLLDAGLPESAPLIAESIRRLGFRVEDIELILNSHAHFDHAGGIAALQKASGAEVAASPASAAVLLRGSSGPDDPQYGEVPPFPPVQAVRTIADGERLTVGPIELTARFTPGHTKGGTSWSWRSCEGARCLSFVYADSQTAVSAEGFRFTDSPSWPTAVADFERGLAVIESLECDVLLTPHPGASRMWERLAGSGEPAVALTDADSCRRYAAAARDRLARRIAAERAQQPAAPPEPVSGGRP